MDIELDVKKLQKIAVDFYNATGIGMFICFFGEAEISSLQQNPYCGAIHRTKEGQKRCEECDDNYYAKAQNSRQPQVFVCHGGLINVVIPLFFESKYVGYMTFCGFRNQPYEKVLKCISDLTFDNSRMEDFYGLLPEYDKTKFESIVSLATIICENIITPNLIKQNTDENFKRAKAFILNNLDKELSVDKISKGANVSKSVLYRLFAKNSGCTVSEYVNRKRVELAAKMLVSTNQSVSEIAQNTGFNNTTYFRSVFKKRYNKTPIKYRKENIEPKV